MTEILEKKWQVKDQSDKAALTAICQYSIDKDAYFIDFAKIAQSPEGQNVTEESIRNLFDSGYLENLQQLSGGCPTFQVTGRGFREVAHLVGFSVFERMLQSAIRRAVEHGLPMSGGELAEALKAYGLLSKTAVLYVLKGMEDNGWIRFARSIGGAVKINVITVAGRQAGESSKPETLRRSTPY